MKLINPSDKIFKKKTATEQFLSTPQLKTLSYQTFFRHISAKIFRILYTCDRTRQKKQIRTDKSRLNDAAVWPALMTEKSPQSEGTKWLGF